MKTIKLKGAEIRASRKEAKITQTKMAELLFLSGKSRISEYESNKSPIPAITWAYWHLIKNSIKGSK